MRHVSPHVMFLAIACCTAVAWAQEPAIRSRPAAPNALRGERAASASSLPVEQPKPIGKIGKDARVVVPKPGGNGVIAIDRRGKVVESVQRGDETLETRTAPHQEEATAIAVSRDGRTAIAEANGTVSIFRTEGWRPLGSYKVTGSAAIESLKFSPDGGKLMALGADGVLHRWGENGRELAVRLDKLGAKGPLDFSARGGYLVAAPKQGTGLILWDVARQRRLHVLENSGQPYALVAISDDERWIAAVPRDSADHIDLWRADTGRHVGVLRAAGGEKHKLRFSDSGDQLLVFDEDGQGVVLEVPSGVDQRRFQAARPREGVKTEIAPDLGVTQLNGDVVTTIEPKAAAAPRYRSALPAPSLAPAAPMAAEPTEVPHAAQPGDPAAEPAAPGEPAPVEPAASEPEPAEAPSEPAEEPVTRGLPTEEEPAAEAPEETVEVDRTIVGAESSMPTASAEAVEPHDSTVTINYATNRNRLLPKDRVWSAYFVGFFGSLPAFIIYAIVILSLLIFPWFGKRSWGLTTLAIGAVVACSMAALEAQVRSKLRDEMTGELYGCRPTDLSYGQCEVSVPKPENRQAGEVNRPFSVWIFEAPENPDKHFMLKRVEEIPTKDAFFASLSGQLAKTESKSALVFIHGYNVSFEDAIFHTAQLAVDLKFPGAPIAFCWPSCADPVKYTFDEQHAEVSIPALREFLQDVALRSGAKRVHIIAHSMGNRVLAGALKNMDPAALKNSKEIFQEIVLAAPDIDSRVFRTQILPHINNVAQNCTLYTSSRDRALLVSRAFHNYQRLGESEPDLLVEQGIETIDATMVDTSLLGHSYIGDARSIVSDLHLLLVSGKRPGERMGLETLRRGELAYWTIKP